MGSSLSHGCFLSDNMGCTDSKPEVKNTKRLSGGNKQALDADLARMKEEALKNSQEHKDSRGFMANSEKEAARLDLPASEGKSDNGTLWYKYNDQRVKYVRLNGDVTISHVTGPIEKYEETGGIKTTKFRDGGKKVEFADGTTVENKADGSEKQTNPDGSTAEKSANGHQMQTMADGATRETHADDELIEVDFIALGASPGGEQIQWPKIKIVQKPAEGAAKAAHYKAADGTNIQKNVDGTFIVTWKPGHVKEADAHYGAEPWMMHVAADGETTYIKNGVPDEWVAQNAEVRRKEAVALIPASEPISQGESPASEHAPAFAWYKYADKSVKRVMENGDLQITYESGEIETYAEARKRSDDKKSFVGVQKTTSYRTGIRKVEFATGVTLEVYPDGTKKQTELNGECTTYYPDESNMEKFTDAAGQKTFFFRDGSRKVIFADGNSLEVGADNTQTTRGKDGTVKVTSPNGHVVHTRADGASLETASKDALIVIDFPLGSTPSGKPLVWPAIKTIQKPPTGTAAATHYEALDGTTIQANPDGSKLVNWKPGYCAEADEHYGATEWCMSVNPDGSTKYMSKPSADANWVEDSW